METTTIPQKLVFLHRPGRDRTGDLRCGATMKSGSHSTTEVDNVQTREAHKQVLHGLCWNTAVTLG